jgi:hypothetical protein
MIPSWAGGEDSWAGGEDRHLRECDYQIEHQPSHSRGVFERDMRPM